MAHAPAPALNFRIKDFPSRDRWLRGTMGHIERDFRRTSRWRSKLAHFYQRRHCLLYRDPSEPWLGSSNIVPPLIDKTLTKQKPGFLNMVLGGTQFVTTDPLDPESYNNAQNFELYMNSILEGRAPVFSMPDFPKQVALIVENVLQHSIGFWRIGPSFQTAQTWRQIRDYDLPGVLKVLTFMSDNNDVARARFQQRMQDNGQDPNPPEIREMFAGEMVNPVTPRIFDRHRKVFRSLVVRLFGMDIDDPADKNSVKDIMQWLRQGMPHDLVVKMRTVIENTPRMWSIQPTDLIFNPGIKEMQNATRITERLRVSEVEFWNMHYDRKWSRQKASRAASAIGERSVLSMGHLDQMMQAALQRSDADDGIDGEVHKEQVELLRISTCHRFRKDGPYERIVAIVEPHTHTVLEIDHLPYNHGMWDYVEVRHEENEPGMLTTRSVPEIIDDSDLHMTAAHRARLNGLMLQSSQGFFTRRKSGLSPDEFKFGPGVIMECDDPLQDQVPMAMPAVSPEWAQEEQFHAMWVDDHLGEPSTLTRDARLLEPITATESTHREQKRVRMSSMRGTVFLHAMHRAYQMLGLVAQQYAPDRFLAQVSGGSAQLLKRSEVGGVFTVSPWAAVGNMDPEFRAQKAMNRLQVTLQMLSAEPSLRQDPQFAINIMQLFREWLDEDDPRASQRIMVRRPPEVTQQMIQQKQQQMQELAEMAALAKKAIHGAPMTVEEMADLAREVTSRMPQKGLQAIIGEANQAESDLLDTMSLAASA